jgi:hypothetical protein
MSLTQIYPPDTTGLAMVQHGSLNVAVHAAVTPALFDAYFDPAGEHRHTAEDIADIVANAARCAVLTALQSEPDAREVVADAVAV